MDRRIRIPYHRILTTIRVNYNVSIIAVLSINAIDHSRFQANTGVAFDSIVHQAPVSGKIVNCVFWVFVCEVTTSGFFCAFLSGVFVIMGNDLHI